MIELSCSVCRDLIPLVQDGVASPESVEAVTAHTKNCPHCARLLESRGAVSCDSGKMFHRLWQQVRLLLAMVMMFGIFFGLMLTAGSNIFYNAVIMPLIGATGYFIFRRHGLYIIPGLLFVTHFVTNALGLGAEYLSLPSLLMWTGLYCLFALAGFFVAALLRFALKKED